jgi:hypothetical protein
LKWQIKCGNDSDEEWKRRSNNSATAMFMKYKLPDSRQVLSDLFGSVGLYRGLYEVADSDVGGYRLILR